MLYLSLFCLNLSYKSLDVYNSGGGVVPNSDVYKYSDPYPSRSNARRARAKAFEVSKRTERAEWRRQKRLEKREDERKQKVNSAAAAAASE